MPELRFVTVVNPCGAPQLSYRHARRYVRQGRAVWLAGERAIRFVEGDRRHLRALETSRTLTAAGYDARGAISLHEIRGVPCRPVRPPLAARTADGAYR